MANNENRKSISVKEWLIICVGLILVGFCIIGATNETFIGQFLTYSSAYVFGLFYPVFLVSVACFGVRLVYSHKGFPIKHYLMIWIGIILLSLSLLAFASFGPYREDNTDLASLVNDYSNRMKGFASTPFVVNNFGTLNHLGGGYLGTFLLALFGTIWGYIGNAVFFALLAIFAMFLICFRPIADQVHHVMEFNAKKVKYESPYQGKESQHLTRGLDQATPAQTPALDPKLSAPLDNDWKNLPQGGFSSTPIGLKPEDVKPLENKQPQMLEENKPVQIPTQPEMRQLPLQEKPLSQSAFTPAPTPVPSTPVISPAPSPITPTAPVSQQTAPSPFSQPYQQPSYQQPSASVTPASDFGYSSHQVTPAQSEQASMQARAFSERANSPEATTFDLPEEPVEPQPQPTYQQPSSQPTYQQPVSQQSAPQPTRPVVNPLAQAAQNSGAVSYEAPQRTQSEFSFEDETLRNVGPQSNVGKTMSMPEPVVPEPVSEVHEPTDEEREEMIAERYFQEKREREAKAIQNKRAEKEAKRRELYRFVSPVPVVYNYPLPTDIMLEDKDDTEKMSANVEAAKQKGAILNQVFNDYNIRAKVISYTIGASVTRFNVETEPGEKSDKLNSIVSELQKALNGDKSVRVETVVEGKSTSGIEVRNAESMAVSFKSTFKTIEIDTKENLLLPIGQDISGQNITFPLNKMPHLLVAGTTGSGKSVLIHSMIMTLIMRNYPSQLKLMLIDPKQVEFVRYQGEPHLFCPVISKPSAAVKALGKLCVEMDRRFSILSDFRCSNYEEYADKRIGNENTMEELPVVVCIIDEFADLMQTAAEAASYVSRLAQKARASGIYLIVATQRPSKDNVPMIIKANIPCRIGLSVSSQIDSRVILDENGAETLLGKGDLLFKCPGKKSMIRCQSPFVSNRDIEAVLAYDREKAGNPNYNPNFLELDDEEEVIEENKSGSGDEVYDMIKDFVVHTGLTSKTSLMHNFNLTSLKADQYLSKLVSDNVIECSIGGKYVLSPHVTMM